MTAKVKCSWCNQEVDEENVREVFFLGQSFRICEQDFQLMWRGFAGLKALSEQFKASRMAKG
jgi:hypothetical protein